MKFFCALVFCISCYCQSLAQQVDGYWDKEHAVLKDISLCAGCRAWRSIPLPVGTTEVGFRITLLGINQELANHFADLLTTVPSGGYTQGAAAGIKFFSLVVGDDKCQFYVFDNSEDAKEYTYSGEYSSACYKNISPINREANFLKKESCLSDNPDYLYFAFQSTNESLNERIVLEVVPWINRKASRGWTKEMKEKIYSTLNDLITKNAEEYELSPISVINISSCSVEKLVNRYTVQEYLDLAAFEQNEAITKIMFECGDEETKGN